jgi:hypothetical protein
MAVFGFAAAAAGAWVVAADRMRNPDHLIGVPSRADKVGHDSHESINVTTFRRPRL